MPSTKPNEAAISTNSYMMGGTFIVDIMREAESHDFRLGWVDKFELELK